MRLRPLPVLITAAGAVLLGAALSACTAAQGPRVTEVREVGDVTAVVLATSGTLRIEHGTTSSLEVTAGEQILPRLTSEVRGGVLELGSEPRTGWGSRGPIEYRLVLTDLTSIGVHGSGDVWADAAAGTVLSVEVRGSGDVEVTDVRVDDVMVAIQGSGDVRLSGTTLRQRVSIEGSGDYSASGLSSESASVVVRGSGDASVAVSGSLDASIAGSGRVTYSGDAQVTSDVAGSGTVRRG